MSLESPALSDGFFSIEPLGSPPFFSCSIARLGPQSAKVTLFQGKVSSQVQIAISEINYWNTSCCEAEVLLLVITVKLML